MKNKHLFRTKQSLFCSEKGSSNVKWATSCKKDQTCCFTISSIVWCLFYRNCFRKTLVAVGLLQIDLLVLMARGIMLQPSHFLYLFVTRSQHFFLAWDDKIRTRDIFHVCNNNLWYIFAIGKKLKFCKYYLESIFQSYSWLFNIPILVK